MKDHVFHGPGQSAPALSADAFPTTNEVGVPDGHVCPGGTVAVDLAGSRLEAAGRLASDTVADARTPPRAADRQPHRRVHPAADTGALKAVAEEKPHDDVPVRAAA
ncbi:hypothetical protein [Streptomyces sp. NPDC008092]|uniref:hypothetical protein n=1 Tax=Streptomyces sp. NPDC008092 TaxID=3364808 RepID=UPI0036EA579A